MKLIPLFAVLLAGLTAQAQHGNAAPSATDIDKTFTLLGNQYFDEYYFKFNPTQGTAAGFHQYDNQLEDYSRATIDKQIVTLKSFQKLVGKIDLQQLTAAQRVDQWLLLNDINARLLTLENIRPWEKNPDIYSSNITNSIFVIMARTFAPPAQRLKSVIAREKQVPAVFQAARQNLKNPPPIYVDVALEQIPGIISFFQKDVPEAFKAVKDQALLAQFHASNQKVMDELKSYQEWLQKVLKPQAHGDFRIGAENYRRKLLYDEDVDIPLDRLLEIGMANLRLNQQAFKDTAAKIDPNKTRAADPGRTGKGPSRAGQTLADFPRHAGRTERFPGAAPNRPSCPRRSCRSCRRLRHSSAR